MNFRGRGGGRGGGRGFGGGRGGNFRGGRGGGRGGFHGGQDAGPPEEVIEFGYYTHPCEDDLVVKSTMERVPYFNAPVFLENKQQIGKVDEIFGPIRDYFISVKLSDDVKAKSFQLNTKLFVDPLKLLPLARFLPQPKGAGVNKPGGRGGRGGFRGDVVGEILEVGEGAVDLEVVEGVTGVGEDSGAVVVGGVSVEGEAASGGETDLIGRLCLHYVKLTVIDRFC